MTTEEINKSVAEEVLHQLYESATKCEESGQLRKARAYIHIADMIIEWQPDLIEI